jgi:alpha-L-fucosidase 2
MKNESIFYKQPANDWVSALPIGNGRLGAMVHGRVYKEQIQLNEESIWNKRSASRINHDSLKYLNEVRQHLLEGRPRDAQFLAELVSFGTPHWQSAYQTLGQLTILSKDQHDALAENYIRTLDLTTGIATVEYKIGKTKE